jgi:hypothetical protein
MERVVIVKNLLLLCFFLLLDVLPVQAALPRDAQFRMKDIYEYRQRKLAEYERAQKRHEALMISKEQAVRQELSVSPWVSVGNKSSVAGNGTTHSEKKNIASGRYGRSWIFSVCSLLLIGGCVWWVRIATGSESDR